MAHWVAEYPLNIPHETPKKIHSGMIGNEVWVVHRVKQFEIQMFMFNIDVRKWIKVEYNNAEFVESYYQEIEEGNEEDEEGEWVEVEEGDEDDDEDNDDDNDDDDEDDDGGDEEDDDDSLTCVTITNGKIYMFQSSDKQCERLLEFDREGLQWKLLKQFDYHIEAMDGVVVNDKMYIFIDFEDDIVLKVMCMNTLEFIEDSRHTWVFTEDVWFNIVEHNGIIYVSFIEHRGKMSFYSIAEHSYKPAKLYEEDFSEKSFIDIFLYERNNNIYQVLDCDNGQMTIECFDFDKNVWKDKVTLKMEHDIIGIFGKDGKVYVAWGDEEAEANEPSCAIHVLDMDIIKLSTLCAFVIAENASEDEIDEMKNALPVGLGCLIDDALTLVEKEAPPPIRTISTEAKKFIDEFLESSFSLLSFEKWY